MTDRNRRVPVRGRGRQVMADAEHADVTWHLLGHCLPQATIAHYGHFDMRDSEPVVEPLPGGDGSTVSFVAGGRPFTAHLPGVSPQEARMRAHMARRLLQGARVKEMQAEALLRPGPAPTPKT